MTIKIKDTDYKFKPTLRALFVWEQIMQKSFELKTTLDNYVYFYSLLLANNENFMTWDEFVDALDADPQILNNINKILNKQSEIDKIFESDETDTDGKKKE